MKYLLVAGGSSFNDRETLYRVTDELIEEDGGFTVIVEGASNEADALALDYAKEHGMQYVEFCIDNRDEILRFIAERNGVALFFQDEEDEELQKTINSARRKGIDVQIWSAGEGGFL